LRVVNAHKKQQPGNSSKGTVGSRTCCTRSQGRWWWWEGGAPLNARLGSRIFWERSRRGQPAPFAQPAAFLRSKFSHRMLGWDTRAPVSGTRGLGKSCRREGRVHQCFPFASSALHVGSGVRAGGRRWRWWTPGALSLSCPPTLTPRSPSAPGVSPSSCGSMYFVRSRQFLNLNNCVFVSKPAQDFVLVLFHCPCYHSHQLLRSKCKTIGVCDPESRGKNLLEFVNTRKTQILSPRE